MNKETKQELKKKWQKVIKAIKESDKQQKENEKLLKQAIKEAENFK